MTHTFALSTELLEPVVRKLLSDSAAQVLTFEMVALKPGVGNPTSLGIYRASGLAKCASGEQPFSLVVKHLTDGQGFMDASQPTHWNYFKREIDFFESDVAARIPSSIGFPRYLGSSEFADGTYLFWNEDLGDLTKSKFSWQSCLSAVRLVAELNSIDISDSAQHVWLSVGTARGWLDFRDAFFVPVHAAVLDLVAKDADRAKGFEVYGAYLGQQKKLVDIIASARQTFVHGDFNLNNLVMVSDRDFELIALDWQLCGVSGIGSEVAPIFGTAIELGVIEGTREQFDELCRNYVVRFNELNGDSPVELDEVRLVAAAMGFSIVNAMASFFAWPDVDPTRELPQENIENLVDNFTNGLLTVYAKVLNELL